MAEAVDYFENHRHKLRFPWSMYHLPIVRAFESALGQSPGPDVLNVGAGPFFELSQVDARGRRFTICDIDARAIDLARRTHGSALAGADVLQEGAPLPYPDERFDLVVAMDVVEHLPEPLSFLRELVRVTRRGGRLFLTTPNYASKGLVAIENTALEWVARAHGFSRKALHPSKLDAKSFRDLFERAGATRVSVEQMSLGWVLAGRATRG
jgi:SAM-dependent methyltransferase